MSDTSNTVVGRIREEFPTIEGEDAVVTARLVAEIDDFETLYLLRSEGVYTDPTFTGSVAHRTVYFDPTSGGPM